MEPFVEVQRFRQPALVVGLSLVCLYGLWRILPRLRGAFDHGTLPEILLLAVGLAVMLGVPLYIFAVKMTTVVDEDGIHISFWPVRDHFIRYGQIESAEARAYRPIVEYGGWGIRWGKSGRAFCVSGKQGLQLVLLDGKRTLIGTQWPGPLADAVSAYRLQYGNDNPPEA